MKTVVTVNEWDMVTKYAAEAQSFNEIWVNYADDEPPLRAKHPGDPRAALTPWLAHKVSFNFPCPYGVLNTVNNDERKLEKFMSCTQVLSKGCIFLWLFPCICNSFGFVCT